MEPPALATPPQYQSLCLNIKEAISLQQAVAGFESRGDASQVVDTGRRQLLVRPRNREGRRPHSNDSELPSAAGKKVFTDWDGEPSWEWENPRTLYFEPVAGLGNRLRALGRLS